MNYKGLSLLRDPTRFCFKKLSRVKYKVKYSLLRYPTLFNCSNTGKGFALYSLKKSATAGGNV